jgi:hypothetical protein
VKLYEAYSLEEEEEESSSPKFKQLSLLAMTLF